MLIAWLFSLSSVVVTALRLLTKLILASEWLDVRPGAFIGKVLCSEG